MWNYYNIIIFNIIFSLIYAGEVYRVDSKCEKLNIRSKKIICPQTIIDQIPKNQYIYVTEADDKWAKFYKGYSSLEYLAKIYTENGEKVKITASGLNFRTGPDTSYTIINTLSKDTEVIYYGKDYWNNEWGITNYGYCNTKYLNLDNSEKISNDNSEKLNNDNLEKTSNDISKEQIREYQKRLIELNYYCGPTDENGQPDGIFGDYTKRCIQHFQQNNNLSVVSSQAKNINEVSAKTFEILMSHNPDPIGYTKMPVEEFLERIKDIANEEKYGTNYVNGGIGLKMSSYKDKNSYIWNYSYNIDNKDKIMSAPDSNFGFDCVGLIKAVLWKWNNGNVKSVIGMDVNADTMIDSSNPSTDFSNIQVGEAVHFDGHIGVYIGDDFVVESTAGWDCKVQITHLKSKDGKHHNWRRHGKIPYVQY